MQATEYSGHHLSGNDRIRNTIPDPYRKIAENIGGCRKKSAFLFKRPGGG